MIIIPTLSSYCEAMCDVTLGILLFKESFMVFAVISDLAFLRDSMHFKGPCKHLKPHAGQELPPVK